MVERPHLSDSKRKVLTDNIAKTEEWWANQPAEALETIERVAVMMGIPVNLMGKNYDALNPSSSHDRRASVSPID